jgi:hypothetical protein
MFGLWVALASCTSNFLEGPGVTCPPGTQYYFDATFEVDIPAKSWYYFNTSHINRAEPLFYHIQSDKEVELHVLYRSKCPDRSDRPLSRILGRRRLVKIPIRVPEEANVIVNGLYAEEPTHVKVELKGQHKKKPMSPFVRGTIIFVVTFTAGVTYFIKCVLPPLKPKPKMD